MKKNQTSGEISSSLSKKIKKLSSLSDALSEAAKCAADINDIMGAKETIDNLVVKPFGDGGSHIVITGSRFVGKKVKVVVKEK